MSNSQLHRKLKLTKQLLNYEKLSLCKYKGENKYQFKKHPIAKKIFFII